MTSPEYGMEMRLWSLMEQQQHLVPFMVDEEQMRAYRESREYLFNGGDAQRFERRVEGNMLNRPDKVTTVLRGGENRGTNKGGRCAQAVAETLFYERFKEHLLKSTGREAVPHYFSLGLGLKYLGERGFVNPLHHPFYDAVELRRSWDFIFMATAHARMALPRLYPQYVHRLELELPLTLMGNALNVDPDTFVDFALTNPKAQEDAAVQSDSLENRTTDFNLHKKFLENEVKTDYPDIMPQDIKWNQGTRESMIASRGKVNDLMLKAQAEGMVEPRVHFTEEELRDPTYRSEVALQAYITYLIKNDWRIPKGHWHIGNGNYILGEKHYFVRLLSAYTYGPAHHLCPLDLDPVLELVRTAQ